MSANIFSGVVPALMTPCKDKELIDAGMPAVVYCGSMDDWPLLTDARRTEGVECLVMAGIPVIVGTGTVNTASTVAHAAHARKVGAKAPDGDSARSVARHGDRGPECAFHGRSFRRSRSTSGDLQ